MRTHWSRIAASLAAVLIAAVPASAQWKGVRTNGPRLPDGKLNLEAAASPDAGWQARSVRRLADPRHLHRRHREGSEGAGADAAVGG